MKKTIINRYQLDHLVDIGVLYKEKNGTYQNLINHKVWGYVCMPKNMVKDVAGKTVNVKVDKGGDDEADRWVTDDEKAWYIQPWMLADYYDKISQWGKYKPVPSEEGGDVYVLRILSKEHLDKLVEKGIVRKEKVGAQIVYRPVITDMGDSTMPDIMAEELCGKIFISHRTDTDWVEHVTKHSWFISQWMFEYNYEYLLSRREGYLNPEDEFEEEEDDEEEDTPGARNFVNLVGEITEKSESVLILSVPEVTVLVHVTDCDYGVGQHVNVEGYLMRTANMMGYPEVNCTSIQEV